MKIKEELSYSNQILYSSILNGTVWIIAGILKMINNNVCTIISSIALFVGAYFCLRAVFSKREKPDEMAERHESDATRIAFYTGVILLVFLVVLCDVFRNFSSIEIRWEHIIPSIIIIITGIMELIVGIVYFILERE